MSVPHHLFGSLALASLLLASPAQAQFAPADRHAVQPARSDDKSLTPEAQGHADRQSFETWVTGLDAGQRRGADFWAQERSKPAPRSCHGTEQALDPVFVAGCQEAQRRLALPDIRRKTEPGYRIGWNAPVETPGVERPTSTSAPPGESRQNQQRENRPWYILSLPHKTCFLLADTFGVRTPEELVSGFRSIGDEYVIHRTDEESVQLYNLFDKDNILALYRDKTTCDMFAKLKWDAK
jgi:hypothetical protein